MQLSKDGSTHVTNEVINTITHLVGALFALFGGAWMIVRAGISNDPWKIVAFSLYAASLIILFLASTLHHGLPYKKSASFFRKLDYSAIFLLIAGSITPYAIVSLRGPFGWTLFGATWIIAIIGIGLRSSISNLPKWVTNTLFVTLGWFGALAAIPLYAVIPFNAILLLFIGGVIYTLGSFIFLFEKPNTKFFGFHEIWHIFVLAGALAHWLSLYLYVL